MTALPATDLPDTQAALLVLDVDGVLSPFDPQGSWPDFAATSRTRMVTLLSAQMGATLAALPAQRVWLTDWETAANRVIGATLSWPELPVLTRRTPSVAGIGWWKLAALRAYRPRAGRALVWVDDQLESHPEASRWAARLATPSLLISPNPLTGLTPEHVASIAAFLEAHPGRSVQAP